MTETRSFRKGTCVRRDFSAAALFFFIGCSGCVGPSKTDSASHKAVESAGALTAASDSASLAALLTAREAVWRAWFTGDSAQLVALLPEEMIGMGETRAQIIANAQEFARGTAKYQGITFSDDEHITTDSMVVTFARYEVTLLDGGKPQKIAGKAIEVFKLVNGRWLNPSWHLHNGAN